MTVVWDNSDPKTIAVVLGGKFMTIVSTYFSQSYEHFTLAFRRQSNANLLN